MELTLSEVAMQSSIGAVKKSCGDGARATSRLWCWISLQWQLDDRVSEFKAHHGYGRFVWISGAEYSESLLTTVFCLRLC